MLWNELPPLSIGGILRSFALVPVVLLAGSLLYFTGTVIYNLFFHPLRHYPGPKFWAATRLPWHRHTFGGTYAWQSLAIHKKYGHIVRIAPNDVSYTSAEALKELYSFRKGEPHEFPKDPIFQPKPVKGKPTIVASNREDHARYRRLLSHAFSDKGLRDQEPKIHHYVDLFMQRLGEREGLPLNMSTWFTWFTFDLIGDLAFGEPFNCLRDAKPHPWIEAIAGTIKSLPYVNIFRRYKLDWALACIASKEVVKQRMSSYLFAKAKIDARIKFGAERGDFWDKVITVSNKDVEQEAFLGMTHDEMVTNGGTLVIAGSETTATLLSGTVYLLLRHPNVMKKLIAEVRGQFQSEEEITISSVGNLKYAIAVLEEAMRIYPPVPTNPNRLVPSGGAMVCGKFVPEGTSVLVPQFAAHHSPLNFYKPEGFIPERFLPDDPDYDPAFSADDHAALQPFVLGPRNCIGRNLAYAEMRLVLARLVWGFDLQLVGVGEEADPDEDWLDQKALPLWCKKPLWVKVKKAVR